MIVTIELKIKEKADQAIWKKASRIIDSLRENLVIPILSRSNLIYTVLMLTDDPKVGKVDQLGRYYDLRYMQDYRREKFLAGLSNYNDDEIVEKIEREVIESTKERRKELEGYNIEKAFVTENISKLLLECYPDLNIRELAICYMIIWTEWDMGTAFYFELISRMISGYMKLFFSIKHLQDTIQGLIHKGIIFPMIGHNDRTNRPFIYLTLSPQLEEEGYKTISC